MSNSVDVPLRIIRVAALVAAIALLAPGAGMAAARGEPFDPVSALYEKGNEYFRRGAYASAISVFQLVSENHPEHVLASEAMFSIASAHHKMGDLAAARGGYEELARRYPAASAVPDALLQLGSVLTEMGDGAEARKVWSYLIENHKGSIAAKIAQQRLPGVEAPASPTLPVAAERAIATPAPSKAEKHEPDHRPPESPVSHEPVAIPAAPSVTGEPEEAVYVVKKGDSLSKIAKALLGSTDRYKELAKYNKIPPPYTLDVGQKVRIPGRKSKSELPTAPPPASEWAHAAPPKTRLPPSAPAPPSPPAAPPESPGWQPLPSDAMEQAVGSIQKWVDERSEGYDALQTRLLELQRDVRAQKVIEKQLEILKAQLEAEKQQNARLKQELIEQTTRLKEIKDKNLSMLSQLEGLTDAAERSKAMQARAAELDAQLWAHKQKMETLEKQNAALSETLQKMRDAFDAQIALVKIYYDSELVKARDEYTWRLDTTTKELARLREETRKKDESLNELKRDYADLMKKTASIQRDAIADKQTKVSAEAARQALDRAKDLRRAGKPGEAEMAYKEALNVYPDNADAMNGLAYLYAEEKKNLDDAEKLVERAIAIDPQGRGYYLDTLGWIHFVRTAYAAALDALHEAHRRIPVEDLPARAAVHFHIGKVYQALADKDKAFFHFIDSIKLAPRTRWATLSERELDAL